MGKAHADDVHQGAGDGRKTACATCDRRRHTLAEFIGGLELGGLFYAEAVRPILDTEVPGLRHSAALLGYGSEILGFDTPRSADHEWGPRLLLFLSEEDHAARAGRLDEVFRNRLPYCFRGHSTSFAQHGGGGSRVPEARTAGPVNHKIEIHTIGRYFQKWLGLDPREPLSVVDWLTLPGQKLLEVTAGRVYHDGLGELEPARARLACYPRDVWLYLLASQWRRIAQQEAFVGRTGEVGDELGSALIGADLVRDLMRLCFLMERRYAPYPKWFGTAFARLACAPTLGPVFEGVLSSQSWREREGHLARAYEAMAAMHNALGVTPPLDARVSPYFGRPFLVIDAGRFVEALHRAIADPEVRAVNTWIGSVDQLANSTDVLSYPTVYRRLRVLYEPEADPR